MNAVPVVNPLECYRLPTHWLTGWPRRRPVIDGPEGRQLQLINTRPFWDWGMERNTLPRTMGELALNKILNSVRDGDGWLGHMAPSETPEGYEVQVAELNVLIAAHERPLWLGFDDRRVRGPALPLAPYVGVVADMEYPGPRFIPVVEDRNGQPGMVPRDFLSGYVLIES